MDLGSTIGSTAPPTDEMESMQVHALQLLLPAFFCATSAAPRAVFATLEEQIPQETIDVRMPAGDQARGIPMPEGSLGQEVYRQRRARLMEAMEGGAAVIFGATRIDDGDRQDMDFYYLTGLAHEAGAALVLAPENEQWNEYLFLAPVDPEVNRWDGERAILGRAVELGTGFAQVMRTSRLGGILARAVLQSENQEMVFLGPVVPYTQDLPRELEVSQKVTQRIPGADVRLAHRLLPRQRQQHEEAEIQLIQGAIDITQIGLEAAMRSVHPGLREYELKTIIEDGFRRGGARRNAFPTIVGSGPNGAVLHYRDDSRPMQEGELVLCDVGAELENYAADVTRTFPVSGRFTARQREIYEIVLEAQAAGIAQCRPGANLRRDIHAAARKVIEAAGFTDAFFHGTSHFLGLDVHDAGLGDEPLVPGTIVTVEPGIYLADEALGIRIEDDILITEDGHRVLSARIPKTVEQIEALMQ